MNDELERMRKIHEVYVQQVARLADENKRFKTVLEKICDQRKRDHVHADAYTDKGCLMKIAFEALYHESNSGPMAHSGSCL